MKSYSFIISDKRYLIKDEKDLELILKLFYSSSKVSSIITWNILMEIDSDLEQIITSYQWLLKCLKYMNEKNAFLFLVKLWDVLIHLINNSQELGEILSKIPDESNKLRLLNILRVKWLKKILFNAADLGNILEWIYGKTQREFIDFLWKDLVKDIFLWTNEIIMILHYLSNENKDYLMNIIWLNWIKHKIKTSQNFLVMFKWLTVKKSKELLKIFTKNEILDLFKTKEEFYDFMIKLPNNKEKIFLQFLA